MADASPAEILLNNSAKIEPLIKRLQAVLMAPVPYVGIDPIPAHKSQNSGLPS